MLLLFIQKEQFAQMVDIAQGVQAVVEPVAAPAIMQASASKLGQNANSLQGFLASFGMDAIVGQCLGGTDVNPPALPRHVQTAFILMDDLRVFQRLGDLLLH